MPRGKGHRKGPAPKKPPLTHFLCLPLVTAESKPQLEESLARFKADVMASAQIPNAGPAKPSQNASEHGDTSVNTTIHPKAIRPVGVLHLTLGVMSLDRLKLEEAINLLQSLDIPSLLPQLSSPCDSLEVSLTGLESMNDPRKTSILYFAPHDATERLYPLCVALQTCFREAGFLVPDDRPLKLHATIVNTIYAKRAGRPPASKPKLGFSHDGAQASEAASAAANAADQGSGAAEEGGPSSGHGPNANAPLKFDARGVLEQYQGFKWAEDVALDRVAICEMGAKKRFGENGEAVAEYVEVASARLPGA